MSARRRVFRSSSQGEMNVFSHLRPIESRVSPLETNERPVLVNNVRSREGQPQQPRPRVTWTLGSPVKDDDNFQSNKKKVDHGFCGFLKTCSLCKNELKDNADVYMYGYLRAFCSSDCRDDQIALDGFDKEVSKESTQNAMGGLIWTKNRQGLGTKRLK